VGDRWTNSYEKTANIMSDRNEVPPITLVLQHGGEPKKPLEKGQHSDQGKYKPKSYGAKKRGTKAGTPRRDIQTDNSAIGSMQMRWAKSRIRDIKREKTKERGKERRSGKWNTWDKPKDPESNQHSPKENKRTSLAVEKDGEDRPWIQNHEGKRMNRFG